MAITRIIETTETGELNLSAELVGSVPPHTRFLVRREGDALIVQPEDPAAVRRAQAAGRLLEMTASLPPGEEPPMDEINDEIHAYRRERDEQARAEDRP